MNVFITWDYELYFGQPTGSAEKCMLEPTDALLALSGRHRVPMTFFVDCGYLCALDAQKDRFAAVRREYDRICRQTEAIVQSGSEVQLHIHPHWEDSFYDGNEWKMDVRRYKLADFSKEDAADIIGRYKGILEQVSGQAVNAYRAGGWCVQPFPHISEALRHNGIVLDSSVFKGGFFQTDLYSYDFRNCPEGTRWRFGNDPCLADPEGDFIELPISNYTLSPLFFWRLFLLGRLNPESHKPVGNGKPVPSPGMRKKLLSRWNNHFVSGEGYFVTRLPHLLKQASRQDLNVLGHPKACTRFSLQYLDSVFSRYAGRHDFRTVSSVIGEM